MVPLSWGSERLRFCLQDSKALVVQVQWFRVSGFLVWGGGSVGNTVEYMHEP